MKRESVKGSTQIKEVGYDESTQTLEVKFRNRSVYQYDGVPSATHEALMAAPSMGGYFYQNIRDVFPYRRVE